MILFNRTLAIVTSAIAIVMVIYQLIAPFYLLVGPNHHQLIHLSFALLILFLVYMRQAKKRWLGITLAALYIIMTIIIVAYTLPRVSWLELRSGLPSLPIMVVVIGIVLTFLVLEATRKSFGLAIPIVCLVFVVYAYVAQFLPGLLHGPSVTINRLFIRLGIGALGVNGIFGPVLGMSANLIFLFFVYGALLQITGGTRFFIEVGKFVGRKLAGGAALTSVVSSALVGTITGSPGGNVALTGSFTIPMMKKAGYAPYQAGAIEATASTGGALMPPVMGLVAFLMAALTGIPYIQICIMATIPAILYFLSAGLYAQFHAMKMSDAGTLAGMEDAKVDFGIMLLYGPLFVLPLLLLIILLIQGYPLSYTVAIAIFFLVLLSFIRKETRPSLRKWIDGLTDGAITGAGIAATCAAIGVILGSISFTVFIPKVPMIVTSISGGYLFPALVLTAISSIILGMGVSIIVAYIVVVLVTAPALLGMGISVPQAHMFTLYFATIGFVTPPVAAAAIVAARLAGAPFLKTALEASKVAVAGFVVPFLFIYNPLLLLRPTTNLVLDGLLLVCAFVLIITLQVVICGQYLTRLNRLERYMFALIALVVFVSFPLQSYIMIATGLAAFILATLWQLRKRKAKENLPAYS
ncbi:TRAP transporter permease [Chloroflexota bacterium]